MAFAPRASEAPETLRLVGESRARSSRGRDILRNLRWLVKLASENGGLSKPYAWWVIVAPEASEAPETLRLLRDFALRQDNLANLAGFM